ncbi:hypothetical protein BT67DRAFT_390663 [Trichocladium antarcticum]|uniref:Uncharacterized protein n=1 Tax=Trichocladium antarcticum TaxID=1450529 RepID=A0AAN6UDA3_9PEZI|nr:hypothetical protein BT67DRAFT_390663 [Trichocladium antarcticum]
MCKIRLVHFALHDVRNITATQLFSRPHTPGNGDFVSTGLVRRCECDADLPAQLGLAEDANNDSGGGGGGGGAAGLETCAWHRCCAMWYQTVRCQWYWDHAEHADLAAREQPEFACPNCYIASEYHPAAAVLAAGGAQELERRLPGARLDWDGAGLRPFPAGVLYSHEVFAVDPLLWASHPLYDRRTMVQERGEWLCLEKVKLQMAVEHASSSLDGLEADLAGDGRIQAFVDDPMGIVRRLQIARRCVRDARGIELAAAALYGKMMEDAGYVFAFLGKMPGGGESVVASDGSYAISKEHLDLAGADPSAIVAACDGPLKQVGRLQERLARLTTLVDVTRRSHQRPTERGKSPKGISASKKSETRKHQTAAGPAGIGPALSPGNGSRGV